MKEKLFYFPFYPADWLADTSVLTLEEKGAYITIIATSIKTEPSKVKRKNLKESLIEKKNSLKKLNDSTFW